MLRLQGSEIEENSVLQDGVIQSDVTIVVFHVLVSATFWALVVLNVFWRKDKKKIPGWIVFALALVYWLMFLIVPVFYVPALGVLAFRIIGQETVATTRISWALLFTGIASFFALMYMPYLIGL